MASTKSKSPSELEEENKKFRRLLNPVWMQLVEAAMAGDPIDDEARIFNYMGCGCSDFTLVKDFRELMGDEREAVKEQENGQEIHSES